MFGEVDEHTTQETYLGHNMADAIACYHNGRWPTGLELLEEILGRQGNLVTVDDMFLLMQNNHLLRHGEKQVLRCSNVQAGP